MKHVTGETQLRARRTRIKILRAIADRNGIAGFSDIRDSTGLSTGSIYYHLERMGEYVVKDSKHYTITEQGVNLLREIEGKARDYDKVTTAERTIKDNEVSSVSSGPTTTMSEDRPASKSRPEDTISSMRQSRSYKLVIGASGAAALAVLIFMVNTYQPNLFSGWAGQAWSSMAIFAAIAAILAVPAASIVSKRAFLGMDGRLMLSVASIASVLFVSAMFFSGGIPVTSANTATQYDNTLDALLSSYSFQWGLK